MSTEAGEVQDAFAQGGLYLRHGIRIDTGGQ
jgi:hypothetical protein